MVFPVNFLKVLILYMKVNNINPCIFKKYMLFGTNSAEPPRLWTRANSSGRILCSSSHEPLIHAKLKYTVLQYKQDNGGSGSNGNMRSFLSGVSNRNYTRNATSTVKLNNTMYYVDPSIKNEFISYLSGYTIEQIKSLSVDQIRNIIISLKQSNSITIPDNVLLRNIPLSQYKNRYTYLAAPNNWNNDPTTKVPVYQKPLSFDIPFKCGTIITDSTLLAPFSDKTNNIFSTVFGLSFEYLSIDTTNVQYIYVLQNNTCTYTGLVDNLFPAQNDTDAIDSASFWGSSILTPTAMQNFVDTGTKAFIPIFAVIQPGSWKANCGKFPAKFGILFDLYTFAVNYSFAFRAYYDIEYPDNTPDENIALVNAYISTALTLSQANSDLIFVPIQSELGGLHTATYPNGYLVNFPFTTANTTQTSLSPHLSELNNTINQYLAVNNVQYKLLKPFKNNYVNYISYN
jgi:hypothetical protein